MEYNAEGLERFVDMLGYQYEKDRLFEMGLSYDKFAEVLDSIFNPETSPDYIKKFLLPVYDHPVRAPGGGRAISTPARRYESFARYFGIGTTKFYPSYKSLSEDQGYGRQAVRLRIGKFRAYFGIVDKKHHSSSTSSAGSEGIGSAFNDGYSEHLVRNAVRRRVRKAWLKQEIWQRSLDKLCEIPD